MSKKITEAGEMYSACIKAGSSTEGNNLKRKNIES